MNDPIAPHTRRCPLCGTEFSADTGNCPSGCPFSRGCRIVCCPKCGYQDVGETALASRLDRLARWMRRKWG